MTGDPYKVLGISQNASNDEVKRAYRELSRKDIREFIKDTKEWERTRGRIDIEEQERTII